MLEKTIKYIKYSTIGTCIASIAAAVLKVLLFDRYIDSDGFFRSDAVMPYIFITLSMILAALILAASFGYKVRFGKYSTETADPDISEEKEAKAISHPATRMIYSLSDSPFALFSSMLLGFVLIGCAVLSLVLNEPSPDSKNNLISVVLMIFRTLAGIFFISVAFKKNGYSSNAFSLAALLPILWMTAEIIFFFFALNGRPNITTSLFEFLAVTFIVLFFLAESKFTLASPSAYSLRKYICCSQLAVFFTVQSFLSDFIKGIITGDFGKDFKCYEYVIFVAFIVYAAAMTVRVYSGLKHNGELSKTIE